MGGVKGGSAKYWKVLRHFLTSFFTVIELIRKVEEEVTGEGVAPYLSNTLGVDGGTDLGELFQEIEAFYPASARARTHLESPSPSQYDAHDLVQEWNPEVVGRKRGTPTRRKGGGLSGAYTYSAYKVIYLSSHIRCYLFSSNCVIVLRSSVYFQGYSLLKQKAQDWQLHVAKIKKTMIATNLLTKDCWSFGRRYGGTRRR